MTQFEEVQLQLDEFCDRLKKSNVPILHRDQTAVVIKADYDILGHIVYEFYGMINNARLCPIQFFNGKIAISLPNLYDF